MGPRAVVVIGATGAQVQRSDLNDGREVLAAAFSDAHVIFALTDFWRTQSAADEIVQGKAVVDAATQTDSLQHFIWSTLPDPVKMSNGRFLNVHHWKSKSLVAEYIERDYPDPWEKTTSILFPNYFENCASFPARYVRKKDESDVYTLRFPHSPQTLLVRAFLEAGSTYFTKTIAFYSQAMSEAEKLAELERVQYDIPMRYTKAIPSKFQWLLESSYGMSSEILLDFVEQLLIMEGFGNIYGREEFVQAVEILVLTLQTWSESLDEHDLLSKMDQEA
ncbi:uncharacterized protein BDV17DRAFT_278842 [Aspergillus undulatus]|uniref:uncharacterized protein n=1 Tax=Aspergillus undulatus TaxID=1810928 RepID=UPI003CCD12CC